MCAEQLQQAGEVIDHAATMTFSLIQNISVYLSFPICKWGLILVECSEDIFTL